MVVVHKHFQRAVSLICWVTILTVLTIYRPRSLTVENNSHQNKYISEGNCLPFSPFILVIPPEFLPLNFLLRDFCSLQCCCVPFLFLSFFPCVTVLHCISLCLVSAVFKFTDGVCSSVLFFSPFFKYLSCKSASS